METMLIYFETPYDTESPALGNHGSARFISPHLLKLDIDIKAQTTQATV